MGIQLTVQEHIGKVL